MKKLMFVLAGAMFIGIASVNAKNLPAEAAKLPANFKQEIVEKLHYPHFAKNNYVEGEVWMKVTLTDQSEVKVIDLSATNQELGDYVKKELSNFCINDKDFPIGKAYYLKVKFDLIEE